ncbi:MAG: hypothetical protein AAGL98_00155 [Planctomycetota bacterium]
MQLVSTNLSGNLHIAADTINKMGLADFVLTMDFSGSATVVVFRVPDSIAPELRRHIGVLEEYAANPKPEIEWASK